MKTAEKAIEASSQGGSYPPSRGRFLDGRGEPGSEQCGVVFWFDMHPAEQSGESEERDDAGEDDADRGE